MPIPLTIKGESGDSSLVTLEHANTATHLLFSLNNIKGITLKDMTFDNNSRSSSDESFFITNCDSVNVTNCRFESYDPTISSSYNHADKLIIENSTGCNITNNDFSYSACIRLIASSTTIYNTVNITGNNNIKGYNGIYINSNTNGALGGKFIIKNNNINGCYKSLYINDISNNNSNDTLLITGNSIDGGRNSFYCGDQDYVVVKENIFNNDNYFEYVRYVDSIVGNQILNVENKSAITITDGNTFIANNYIHTKGQLESKAIYLSSNSSLSGTVIAHNSIENSGTAGASSYGLYLAGDVSNITVKNNIFSTIGGGTPLFVASTLTNPNWDYNCYYTTGNSIANFNNSNYSSVSALGAAMGSDANSLKVNPFYVSNTNLTVNQSQLQTGTLLASAPLDINGTSRTSPTTMGAKEFVFCSNDAGINSIVNPTAPLS